MTSSSENEFASYFKLEKESLSSQQDSIKTEYDVSSEASTVKVRDRRLKKDDESTISIDRRSSISTVKEEDLDITQTIQPDPRNYLQEFAQRSNENFTYTPNQNTTFRINSSSGGTFRIANNNQNQGNVQNNQQFDPNNFSVTYNSGGGAGITFSRRSNR